MGPVGTMLERWHEPILVGAAVTLFGLGFWGPAVDPRPILSSRSSGTTIPESGRGARWTAPETLAAASDSSAPLRQPPGSRSPRDREYYRQQWASETASFYAANPPRQAASANVLAGMSGVGGPVAKAGSGPSESSLGPSAEGAASIARAAHVAAQPRLETESRMPGRVAVEPSPSVAAAALNTDNPDRVAEQSGIAEHRGVADGATEEVPATLAMYRGEVAVAEATQRKWHVITWLAAGMLASLAFVSFWPVIPVRDVELAGSSGLSGSCMASAQMPTDDGERPYVSDPLEPARRGESIPIRLPGQWVRLRPTMSQTARRGVLGGSYLLALIGTWGLLTSGM